MCAGSHLANRELYVAFTRIFIAFHIREASNPKDRPLLDALGCNAAKTSLTTEPKPFKVGVELRDTARMEEWVNGVVL